MPAELMALLAAACWAAASLFSASASARMGAFAFTRWRMAFASVVLWGIALATGGWRDLPGEGVAVLVLSGLIGIFVGDTALFVCMNRLGPRRSGVLFATHSLFSVVLAWLWLGEMIAGWQLLGCALLAGGVMTAIALGKREGESHLWERTHGTLAVGIGLGLLAALGQSVATLMLKPLMSSGVDAVSASALRMSAGFAAHALLWTLGLRVARAKQPLRWQDLLNTFASAAIAMVLGMTLILKALQTGSAGMVGMFSSVSPVLLLPLLWAAYGRRPALGAWCGAALTVLGCALILGVS